MVTYRKALPSDRDAYIALADMVFSSEGAPIRFEEFVPKVYSPEVDSAQMHYLAVDDARGIVGLVGALPGKLHAGTTSLRTRYIGTVAVHPRARGEGHMKRLMAMALDDMRADGVDLALLNGQRQRYEHFGFAHGGAMLRFHFSAGCIRHALNRVDAGGVEIEPLHVGSPFIEAAMALHAARPLRFERGGAAEFAVICRTSMRRPWTVSRRGEFLGYLIATAKERRLPKSPPHRRKRSTSWSRRGFCKTPPSASKSQCCPPTARSRAGFPAMRTGRRWAPALSACA